VVVFALNGTAKLAPLGRYGEVPVTLGGKGKPDLSVAAINKVVALVMTGRANVRLGRSSGIENSMNAHTLNLSRTLRGILCPLAPIRCG
jgi:hypothetical protein